MGEQLPTGTPSDSFVKLARAEMEILRDRAVVVLPMQSDFDGFGYTCRLDTVHQQASFAFAGDSRPE